MAPIITDFHSHILPGADHGSNSVETSAAQLSIIRRLGVKNVVATPHFYPSRDSVKSFLERRTESVKELRSVMKPDDPMVFVGAEVLICEGIENMEGLEKLTVFGTNCILLEMPMMKWSERLLETVEKISKMNLTPVMAHVDRYPSKLVEELLELDVKAQINPSAFASRRQRKHTMKWLEEGKIEALGSDLHGADERAYKDFLQASNLLGEYAEEINRSMLKLLEGAKYLSVKQ